MNFGSCQNEYDMFGRFFKRFEQGIERLGCEHMNLVNDVNPVFALCGLKLNLVNNLTDIINFLLDAASISTMSRILPSSIPLQISHSPQGFPFTG